MENQEEPEVKRGRKPSKASHLRELEKKILASTLRIQQEKAYYKKLVAEYDSLKSQE